MYEFYSRYVEEDRVDELEKTCTCKSAEIYSGK